VTETNLTIDQAIELALQHHRAGRLSEAETIYRRVLAAMPEHPVALHYLGVIAHQLGRHDDAIDLISRSIKILPRGSYYSNLGEAFRGALRYEEAAGAFRKAIELEPAGPSQHNNLGLVYLDQNDLADAEPHIRRAMELDATYAPAQNNMGTLRHKQGRLDEAEQFFRRAIELDPNLAAAQANLANIFAATNRLDQAAPLAEAAVRMTPNDAHNHLILAQVRLLAGDFVRGWPEYEWRVRKFPFLFRQFPGKPRWNDEPLSGKTILLYGEQGFGDTIQFARFIPAVSERSGAARVIVAVQKELVELIRTVDKRAMVVRQDEPPPPFDTYCSLVSLPGVLGTTLHTIPNRVPYVSTNQARVAEWRERLIQRGNYRVGLVWAGNPTHEKDAERSCRLSDLAPLAGVADFFSLQKGDAAAQAKTPPSGMNLTDVAGELHDFSDSAALLQNLDLLISVDTAAAHLAGAIGIPVWTLLPSVPEWRWMHGRDDSPWYPTMRLFRQKSWGDWNDVATRVADELRAFGPYGR
jgi:tetratricopeptide (TPR) repeat protein